MCDFSEKGQKKAKYLKIWSKVYKMWKYFEKGQSHACDYCMYETARIWPSNCMHIFVYISFSCTITRFAKFES